MNDVMHAKQERLSFVTLLIALLSLILVGAFVHSHVGAVMLSLATSLVLLAGLWSLFHDRALLLIGLIVAVPALGARWLYVVMPGTTLEIIVAGLTAAFMAFNAAALYWFIQRRGSPRADTVYGGVCIYVLLGFIWRELYVLVEIVKPGSFVLMSAAGTDPGPVQAYMMYFSFVTLTTLGYGDVAPVGDVVRTLSTLEAVFGQMFIAIFIARLVGWGQSRQH